MMMMPTIVVMERGKALSLTLRHRIKTATATVEVRQIETTMTWTLNQRDNCPRERSEGKEKIPLELRPIRAGLTMCSSKEIQRERQVVEVPRAFCTDSKLSASLLCWERAGRRRRQQKGKGLFSCVVVWYVWFFLIHP